MTDPHRYLYQGYYLTASELAALSPHRLDVSRIRMRLHSGWSPEDAIHQPLIAGVSLANRTAQAPIVQKELNAAALAQELSQIRRDRAAAEAISNRFRSQEAERWQRRAARIAAYRDRHGERLSEPRRLLLLAAQLRWTMAVHPRRYQGLYPRIVRLCRRARQLVAVSRAERHCR